MHISLTPQLEELVKQKVASGLYTNASEVIQEALRVLEESDRTRHEALHTAVAIGLAQSERGEIRSLNADLLAEIDRNVDHKFAAGKRPKADVLP